MLNNNNLKDSPLTSALNQKNTSINDDGIFEEVDLTSPKLFRTPKSQDGSNIRLMEKGFIAEGSNAAIHLASSTARNAIISPILAEKNNREHVAIILANCSKTIKYKAIYAIIALMASVSFACLWFKVLPANASNSSGSAFNILAIASGIAMLTHSFINQLILWNIDTDFKAQARELIIGFNEGITKQQEAISASMSIVEEAYSTASFQL